MLFYTRLALARKEAHNRKKEKELQVEDGLILLKANALLIVLHCSGSEILPGKAKLLLFAVSAFKNKATSVVT